MTRTRLGAIAGFIGVGLVIYSGATGEERSLLFGGVFCLVGAYLLRSNENSR